MAMVLESPPARLSRKPGPMKVPTMRETTVTLIRVSIRPVLKP